MNERTPAHEAPWYRHAWPWLLMIPPLASVVSGITMLTLAIETEDTLAVSDYAHIEALTAREFERDARARELGLGGRLAIVNAPQEVEIRLDLETQGREPLPDTLELRLQHATRSEFDRSLELQRFGDTYRAVAEPLPSARYALELMPANGDWRLAARIVSLPAELRLGTRAGP